jgi:hypothetical protein
MPNKTLAKTTIALILSLSVVMQVGLAMANPVPWLSTPNQDKPTLTVESPQNNTEYDESDVYLNCTITKPDSWNTPFVPFIGQVGTAYVYLDGNLIYGFERHGSYSVKLNQTSSGPHMLNVTLQSYTYYSGPPYNGSHIFYIQSSSGPVYKYPTILSDIVYFTVAREPSPSAYLLPQEIGSLPTATAATVLLLGVAVLGAGLLAYSKNANHSTQIS